MQLGPSIPEIARRDRFIRQVVAQRMAFAVAGAEGLAHVPSPRFAGREATLLWSSATAAARWAPVVAEGAQISELKVEVLLRDVLPELKSLRHLVGPDWSADAVEPEIDPSDLIERLRIAILDSFCHKVRSSSRIWVLEDSAGPALLFSEGRAEEFVLPCWSQEADARRHIEGPWRHMTAVEIDLERFLSLTLTWLSERGYLVAPDHGAGELAFSAAELKARLWLRR